MSTQKQKNDDNANAQNPFATKTVKEVKTTEDEKNTVLRLMDKYKPAPPTAEERIERILHFEAVSKRFKLLKEKSNELKMWDAGNDKSNASISLKNSSGFEFSVTNSFVIQKIRNVMEQELDILLGETEIEILTFEI